MKWTAVVAVLIVAAALVAIILDPISAQVQVASASAESSAIQAQADEKIAEYQAQISANNAIVANSQLEKSKIDERTAALMAQIESVRGDTDAKIAAENRRAFEAKALMVIVVVAVIGVVVGLGIIVWGKLSIAKSMDAFRNEVHHYHYLQPGEPPLVIPPATQNFTDVVFLDKPGVIVPKLEDGNAETIYKR